MKKFLIILVPIVMLISTFLADCAFYVLQKYHNNENPVIPFGTEIPVYIVISLLLIILAWWVLFRNPRSQLTAWVYIIVGFFALFSMSTIGNFFLTANNPIIREGHTWYLYGISSFYSFTRNCAAIILVIGLVRLLPDKFLWRRES